MTDTLAATATATPTGHPVRSLAPIDAHTALAVDTTGAVGLVDDQGAWTPDGSSPPSADAVAAVSATCWWLVDAAQVLWQVDDGNAQRAGDGISVGAASDGTVWSLDAGGAARQWVGGDWQTRSTEPALRTISVASADSVAGLDAAGSPWVWTSAEPQWKPLPGGPTLASLDVDPRGGLWGVDSTGSVWAWLECWVHSGGEHTAAVEAASDGSLWLLDDAGGFVVLADQFGEPCHPARAVPPKWKVQWDAESVFDETQSTHLWIVNRAARLAAQQGAAGVKVRDLIGPDVHQAGTPFHNGVCQGLYDADFKAPYNNLIPSIGQATYKSHFYNPATATNWCGETAPTALTEGQRFFHEAIRKAGALDPTANYQAGYALGLALHYFTDTTQPMHASNYTAINRPFKFHVHFEEWMMANQAKLPVNPTYSPPSSTDPGDLIKATATRSNRHFRQVWRAVDRSNPFWWTEHFDRLSRTDMGTILAEAINATAQFLVCWGLALTAQRTALAGPLVTMTSPQQVLYLSDTDADCSRLYYSNGWKASDLTLGYGAPEPADDPVSPLGGWFGNQFTYRSQEGHVIALWNYRGAARWTDLTTASGGPAVHEASAFATVNSPQELFMVGVDQQVHRLWFQDRWNDTNLTALTGAPAPVAGTPLAASAPNQSVFHLGQDGHLHCFYVSSGSWQHLDLNAVPPDQVPLPDASTSLASSSDGHAAFYVAPGGQVWLRAVTPNPKAYNLTELTGAPAARADTPLSTLSRPSAQVFYFAQDSGHLMQLWVDGQWAWRCTDLTQLTGAPLAASGSALVSLDQPQPQQVFYVGVDHHVHQVWYDKNWRHTDLSTSV